MIYIYDAPILQKRKKKFYELIPSAKIIYLSIYLRHSINITHSVNIYQNLLNSYTL